MNDDPIGKGLGEGANIAAKIYALLFLAFVLYTSIAGFWELFTI